MQPLVCIGFFNVRSVLFSDTEPAEDPVSNILSRFPAGKFPDDLHRILDLGKDDIRCNSEFHRLFRLPKQFQWGLLLLAGLLFYACAGAGGLVCLAASGVA